MLEEQGKAERRGMAASDRQKSCVGPDLGERTSAICQANQKIQKMGQRAGERPGWEKGRRVGEGVGAGLLRRALWQAAAGLGLRRWWLTELPRGSPSLASGRAFTGPDRGATSCGTRMRRPASHSLPGAPGPPWLSCCPSQGLLKMPHPQLSSANR